MLALERPVPPLGTLRGGPAAVRDWARPRSVPRADGARRHPGALRALRVAAAPARVRDLGAVGRPPLGARSTTDARMAVRPRPRPLRRAGGRCRGALDAPAGPAAAGGLGARRRPVVSRAPPGRWVRWSAKTLRGGRRGDREQRGDAAGIEDVTGPLSRGSRPSISARICRRRSTRRDDPTLVTVGHLVPHKGPGGGDPCPGGVAGAPSAAALRGDRQGARARGARQLAERLGVGRPGRVPRPAAARARAGRDGALPRPRACRARTSRSASPTSRRWGRGSWRSAVRGPGAEDIADAGEGIVLVPPGDDTALAWRDRAAGRRRRGAGAALRGRARDGRRALHVGAQRRADRGPLS